MFLGCHTIDVRYRDVPISGSPFSVEIYDPAKIRVEGLREAEIEKETSFDSKSIFSFYSFITL